MAGCKTFSGRSLDDIENEINEKIANEEHIKTARIKITHTNMTTVDGFTRVIVFWEVV